MKLKKTLTISLAAILSAATISTGTAFAAESSSDTVYPDSFECSLTFEKGLNDYAVYGDSYAFAYSGQLAVLKDNGKNERIPDIKPVSSIAGLEYSSEGKLYVCFADGYCVYPDLSEKKPLSDITIQGKEQYQVVLSGASYSLNNEDGSLLYMNNSRFTPVTLQETYEGEVKFSKLKKYNGTAYAVMNNCLYKMDGATAVKVNPTYVDLSLTEKIATGTAAEALKSDSAISYGWLENGKYYTEIDLKSELGEMFKVPDSATATTLSADRLYCTVLAQSGNSYIITMDGKSYLTAKSSISLDAETPSLKPADTLVAYAIENIGVYSKPYLSPTTKIGQLQSGSTHAATVLGQYTDLNGIEYYKVTFTEGESTVTGYVAKRLMTAYAFPAEDENTNTEGGEDAKYDSNIVTVVLAVIIVALVLTAVLYLGIASSISSRKRRKKARKKKKKAEMKKKKKKKKKAEREKRRRQREREREKEEDDDDDYDDDEDEYDDDDDDDDEDDDDEYDEDDEDEEEVKEKKENKDSNETKEVKDSKEDKPSDKQ